MKICYVSLFYNIGREEWTAHGRSFDMYLSHFAPYINLFTNAPPEYEMIVFLDKRHVEAVRRLLTPTTKITLIEIDEEFMNQFPMWKTLNREADVMDSPEFKNMIANRLYYPETHRPKYTLINHCKVDAVAHVIENNLSDADYFAWVDFGYFQGVRERIPRSFLDPEKLDLDRINYTLINNIEPSDKNIISTLLNAPERVGGFFFFGSKDKILEYQRLYHLVLDIFQNLLCLADDDQHLAMICTFLKPELFRLHHLGGWHRALTHFSL